MIPYSINNVTYNIPTSFEEVTWLQYIEYDKVAKSDDNTFFKMAKIAAALVPGFSYENIKLTEARIILDVYDKLKFVFEEMETPPTDKVDSVMMDNELFYVHDLNETFEDFATYHKIGQDFSKVPLQAIPIQLAHLLRKSGETIRGINSDPELLNKRIKMCGELSVPTVQRLTNFFLFRHNTYNNASAVFTQLNQLTEQLKATTPEDLLKNTAGTARLPIWRKTLLKWILYLLRKQTQYFGS